MITPELAEVLKADYQYIWEIPGRGVCGVQRMLFTTGLFMNLDMYGYSGRYCYPSLNEALTALFTWGWSRRPSRGMDQIQGYRRRKITNTRQI